MMLLFILAKHNYIAFVPMCRLQLQLYSRLTRQLDCFLLHEIVTSYLPICRQFTIQRMQYNLSKLCKRVSIISRNLYDNNLSKR